MLSGRGSLVAVVDGEACARDELLSLVRSDGYEACGFADASSLLSAVAVSRPRCVIAELAGDEANRMIGVLRRAMPVVPVVAVAGPASLRQAVAAMKAGASDVVEKPYAAATMLAAIKDALGTDDCEGRTAGDAASLRLASLTKREQEVLAGLLAGKINKTIGHQLGISPRTVEVYRAHIMRKARVDSLPELVRLALAARMS